MIRDYYPYITLTDNTLTCSIKGWGIISNYSKYFVQIDNYIYQPVHVPGKVSYQMKACVDNNCKYYGISNLITITYPTIGTSSLPAINIYHPVSDNV